MESQDNVLVASKGMGNWKEDCCAATSHVALLPDGHVLCFTGGRVAQFPVYDEKDHTYLWSCNSPGGMGTVRKIDSPLMPGTHDYADLFCCGHAILPDGRLLVAGGNYAQANDSFIFDWNSKKWSFAGKMRVTRYYPTLVTLADGRVLVTQGTVATKSHNSDQHDVHKHGGHQHGAHGNNTKYVVVEEQEVFDPTTLSWSACGTTYDKTQRFYPRLHVLADGNVLCTSVFGEQGVVASHATCVLDVTSWKWEKLCDVPAGLGEYINYATDVMTDPEGFGWHTQSVLLPLSSDDSDTKCNERVLVLGGKCPYKLDVRAKTPSWTSLPNVPVDYDGFHHLCGAAVYLADGTLFLTGGVDERGGEYWPKPNPRILKSYIYDPKSEQWQEVKSAIRPRAYHFSAVLLPDGRVWTAGGEDHCDFSRSHPQISIYSPPYLDAKERPEIESAPKEVNYGEQFKVSYANAKSIDRVTLIRCCSMTHAFSSDQRCINMTIVHESSKSITLKVPTSPGVAPPGPYFLFLLTSDGVPSVAHVLFVGQKK